MYLRQQTWLENGPGGAVAIPVPVLATPARAIAVPKVYVRRGIGAVVDAGPSTGGAPWRLTTDQCKSYWSLLDPRAWFGGCVGPDIADVYQKVQYGTAPNVVTPPASAIKLGVPGSTPGAVYAGNDANGAPVYALPSTPAEDQQALIDKQNAAIDAAAAAGWNPAGNLPLDMLTLSDFWGKFGTPLLIAGGVIGGLALVGTVRR